jgi:hypothetical protein
MGQTPFNRLLRPLRQHTAPNPPLSILKAHRAADGSRLRRRFRTTLNYK